MSSAGMSLDHLISWAMQGGPAPVELTDASVERITLASEHLRLAGRSGAVYGLTTGVGALRTVPTDITPSDGTSHALRLWRSHATGFGETYDDATARAAMAIRLHQITSGRSGVSAGLASSLGAAIAAGAVPDLHRFGSIGTGDLVPLAELGLTLVGERPWRSGGAPVAAVDDGDALPFMSSNALTLATAALVHRRLALLSDAAEKVTALSAAALQASLQAYDPRVHAGRPDASQQGVARRLMALLDPADWVPARVQDPFALRTVPQVHAPFLDALVTTGQAVGRRGRRLHREPARRRRRHAAAPRRLRDRPALRDARRAAPGDVPGHRAVRRPALGADQPVAHRAAGVPGVRARPAARA